MPLVTVIIPAFNPGRYIVPAIESVMAQTMTDWEVMVVDDGSTEDLTYLPTRFPHIRFLRQVNHGLSITRNVAILASDSEFIAFLDADDIWAPTKLQRQIELLKSDPSLGMCHTKWAAVDSSGAQTRDGNARQIDSYAELLKGCDICISSVMVRRSALAVSGLFNPFFKIAQDYDMWLKISRRYKIGFIPSCETLYRIHGGNMSGNFRALYAELMKLLDVHFELASQEDNIEALEVISDTRIRYRSNYGATAFQKCRESFRKREWGAFFAQYRFAFRLMPGFVMGSTLRYLVGMR